MDIKQIMADNADFFAKKPTNLLSVSVDAKTKKGIKKGYMTGILYLSPADIAGKDLCPSSTLAGCREACLNTAGRGRFGNVQMARLRKTMFYHNNYNQFMQTLVKNITSLVKKAEKDGYIPCVRLNGTSDIAWENETFVEHDKDGMVTFSGNIFQRFPDIQFYDYTKLPTRKVKDKNYHLTFSYSGIKAYDTIVQKALKNKMNAAVVFKKSLPATFLGLPVINGDDTDLRFLDKDIVKGQCIVGLTAKGQAKKDTSGFVV